MYWIQTLTAGVYQEKKHSPILFPFFSIIAETTQTDRVIVPMIFKTTCFCLKIKQQKRKRKKERQRKKQV